MLLVQGGLGDTWGDHEGDLEGVTQVCSLPTTSPLRAYAADLCLAAFRVEQAAPSQANTET